MEGIAIGPDSGGVISDGKAKLARGVDARLHCACRGKGVGGRKLVVEECVKVGRVAVVLMYPWHGNAGARVCRRKCGKDGADRERSWERGKARKKGNGVCRSAVEGLADGA